MPLDQQEPLRSLQKGCAGSGYQLRIMANPYHHAVDSGQCDDIDNDLIAERRGSGNLPPEFSNYLHGGPRQAGVQEGGRVVAENSLDFSITPRADREASYPIDPDDLLDMASLAIRVANTDGDADNANDITPLDLGEPFQVWRTFWQSRERENRLPSALPRPENDSSRQPEEAREQLRACTEHRVSNEIEKQPFSSTSSPSEYRSRVSQHLQSIEHSRWSPRSFLRRSDALKGPNSSSSSEKAEILTASVQHLRLVRFPGRAGNGHYVDFEDLGPVDPQPSPAPVVYARVIDINPRRRRRSSTPTTAIIAHQGSVEEPEHGTSAETWEDAIAAADRRYEAEYKSRDSSSDQENVVGATQRFEMEDVWQRAETVVRGRRALEELPIPEAPARGRRLVTLEDGQSVAFSVSPIRIDWDRARGVATPSIHSNGSEFDDSSPLCGLPRKGKHRKAQQESPRQKLRALSLQMIQPDKVSLRERIIGWLKNIVSPGSETRTESASSLRSFKVWNVSNTAGQASKRHGRVFESKNLHELREHERMSKKQLGRSGKAPSAKIALKDVTNLRQPGYLEHNSFFKESTAPTPADSSQAVVPDAAGSTEDINVHSSASVFARADCPNPLAQHPPSGREHIQTVRAQIEGHTTRGSPSPEMSLPSAGSQTPHVPSPKPGRKAVFDDTLARLEGQVAPAPTSPLPKYLQSFAVPSNKQDHSLNHTSVGTQHKAPWSKVLENWKATTGSVERRASMKPPVSAHSHRGLLEGPSNGTPGRGHWFYDAEEA